MSSYDILIKRRFTLFSKNKLIINIAQVAGFIAITGNSSLSSYLPNNKLIFFQFKIFLKPLFCLVFIVFEYILVLLAGLVPLSTHVFRPATTDGNWLPKSWNHCR